MRAAALDLGSNTLRLLVADTAQGDWQAVERGLATPRLGRGLVPGGRLDPAARRAAWQAAAGFCQRARSLGAQRVALAATSACRRAADGAVLVESLGRELGLDSARVLGGREEARLSRRGVLSRLEGPAEGAWLADIGGGSTELMDLGRAQAPTWSLELGSVSLTEAHLREDPPSAGELAALEQAVARGLQGRGSWRAGRLVATAGTAAALASLRLGLGEYRPQAVNNLVVTLEELEAERRRLAALDLARRRRALAVDPKRADIILAGLAILAGLVRRLGLDRFTTMDAGLLEGILLEHAAGI
jgi:exopolyphosphatase/guanosine-5'-triphosphate,3'-diphosphate pyrophosphatase